MTRISSSCPCSEHSYPRLAQMLVDYDSPVKKFSEDFGAISQVGGKSWGWGMVGVCCVRMCACVT